MTVTRVQIGWLASLALHALVFCVGGVLITREVQYGTQIGQTSTEVNLVAAPPEPQSQQVVSPLPPVVETPKPNDMVKPEETLKPQPLPTLAPKPIPAAAAKVAGKDAKTVHASRGAMVAVSPNYLRNPPPVYPEIARRMGQQGTVQLFVEVSAEGNAVNVVLKQSSGFGLLDAAALQSVRHWKFQPATIGGLPVASRIEVPVRFELK
jgi:protein TonB